MFFFMDEQAIADCLEDLPANLTKFKLITEALDEITANDELKLFCIYDYHSFTHNGNTFADLLYAHYADGDYRDAILMFDIAAQKGDCLDNGRQLEAGIVELIRLGIGGCVSTIDPSSKEWWNADSMHWVDNSNKLRIAARELFIKLALPTEKLETLSPIMFPNIHFHADIHNFKRMGIPYREHIETIIHHLAYLCDCSANDFNNDVPATIIQLAASKGVDISPESPNTHANTHAMNKRKIEINGASLLCEWHSKITYNKGRIHFHARPTAHHSDVLKVSKSKIIIGIIAEHLPT